MEFLDLPGFRLMLASRSLRLSKIQKFSMKFGEFLMECGPLFFISCQIFQFDFSVAVYLLTFIYTMEHISQRILRFLSARDYMESTWPLLAHAKEIYIIFWIFSPACDKCDSQSKDFLPCARQRVLQWGCNSQVNSKVETEEFMIIKMLGYGVRES